MTSKSGAIVAWLSNAISERENAALETLDSDAQFAMRRGEEPAPWTLTSEARGEIRDADERATLRVEFASPSVVHHLTVNDPRSILRRCAADRKLLNLHAGKMHSCPATDETGYLDEWTQFDHSEVCPVVKHLAEGYGWTAGQTPPTEGDQVT